MSDAIKNRENDLLDKKLFFSSSINYEHFFILLIIVLVLLSINNTKIIQKHDNYKFIYPDKKHIKLHRVYIEISLLIFTTITSMIIFFYEGYELPVNYTKSSLNIVWAYNIAFILIPIYNAYKYLEEKE
ncbi:MULTISPECIES: hypothetical protein [unclassified Staphylococcus]|uniref:hypothetical protein n=1 Tax=unclassified Staphylococcus TaxID=91994 RepID=UPI0021D13852|nr:MULTISPECIES: hypothetical protein [unclassified Staphylococcus]UXR69231.1 hypothetical protein MUA26_08900 [Staphylococcus sp. IVB6246]UXR71284.1 hypothetical protein MUA88_08925 [Staphylococcus sp. IVB6240]UXR73560.1 hypothetical protein MUA48_09420 [Staphylococcus sp. IVB6238]UXR75876.1 hypothetical protein MUA74_09500 [Staphylococcus sp. IVB6233]UXR80073.1 hypothetical protein MUA65_09105 [Staphylococcus sp. IVB6218]